MNVYHLWRTSYEVTQINQENLSPLIFKDQYVAVVYSGLTALESYIKDKYRGQNVKIALVEYIGLIDIESPPK